MTVEKVLELFDKETENDVPVELKEQWISELDKKIASELNKDRAGLTYEAYNPDDNISTKLNAPEEYSEIYIIYLKMKMNYMLSEIERYNNSASVFNRLFYEMANYISRNFKIEKNNSIKVELNNV